MQRGERLRFTRAEAEAPEPGLTHLAHLGLEQLHVAPAAADPLGIYCYDNSSLEVIGSHLVATLLDGNATGGFSEYLLTGTLAEGTVVSEPMFIQKPSAGSTGASFVLHQVPEPGSIVLFATGGLVVAMLAFRTVCTSDRLPRSGMA